MNICLISIIGIMLGIIASYVFGWNVTIYLISQTLKHKWNNKRSRKNCYFTLYGRRSCNNNKKSIKNEICESKGVFVQTVKREKEKFPAPTHWSLLV